MKNEALKPAKELALARQSSRAQAQKKQAQEAISWCRKGVLAKHEEKVGEVMTEPDFNLEVEVRWSDGSESGLIKAAGLSEATIADQQRAATWCKVGVYAKAPHPSDRVGTLTAEPDSNAEVKLQWSDGSSSDNIKAVRVRPLTAAEAAQHDKDLHGSGDAAVRHVLTTLPEFACKSGLTWLRGLSG